MPKNNSKVRQERRKLTAILNAVNPHAQTAEQQLLRLDQRLGRGVGALRERARLGGE